MIDRRRCVRYVQPDVMCSNLVESTTTGARWRIAPHENLELKNFPASRRFVAACFQQHGFAYRASS